MAKGCNERQLLKVSLVHHVWQGCAIEHARFEWQNLWWPAYHCTGIPRFGGKLQGGLFKIFVHTHCQAMPCNNPSEAYLPQPDNISKQRFQASCFSTLNHMQILNILALAKMLEESDKISSIWIGELTVLALQMMSKVCVCGRKGDSVTTLMANWTTYLFRAESSDCSWSIWSHANPFATLFACLADCLWLLAQRTRSDEAEVFLNTLQSLWEAMNVPEDDLDREVFTKLMTGHNRLHKASHERVGPFCLSFFLDYGLMFATCKDSLDLASTS